MGRIPVVVLGNFQCRNILLIWLIVGQGPVVLSVGVAAVVWPFSLHCHISSFSLSWRRLDIDENLSQRAVKPQNNQPTHCFVVWVSLYDFFLVFALPGCLHDTAHTPKQTSAV